MSSLASEIGELVHSPMGQAGVSGGIEWLGGSMNYSGVAWRGGGGGGPHQHPPPAQ